MSRRTLLQTLSHGPWIDDAACMGADRRIWFPHPSDTETAAAAIDVCNRCPVADECLDYAIVNRITEGIWGGLTPTQRRVLARRNA